MHLRKKKDERRHGNPKNVTHIFSWELPKKLAPFFGSNCKEDMGIPDIFDCFQYKKGTSQFATVFDIKDCELISFFSPLQILRIPIFLR